MRGAWALALALTAAACGEPAPPAVSVRQPSLDADDLAVMKGLIDDRLRPRVVESLTRLRVPVPGRPVEPHFLVVDSTIAVCPERSVPFDGLPGGCMSAQAMDFVSVVLPPGIGRTAMVDFQARNRRRLPIAGVLGDDVSYVSATLADFASDVVSFSAPSYPAPGVAVLFYALRSQELAAVRLERQPDGRWKVVPGGRSGGIE